MGKQEIAAALKSARKFRGFTQVDAAKATNLTYQAISNFERGTNRVETNALNKLCSLYGISVKSILDCREWEPDYVEDFLHATDDAQRREILQSCGPCPRFICEYNDLLSPGTSNFDKRFADIFQRMSQEQRNSLLSYAEFLVNKDKV